MILEQSMDNISGMAYIPGDLLRTVSEKDTIAISLPIETFDEVNKSLITSTGEPLTIIVYPNTCKWK